MSADQNDSKTQERMKRVISLLQTSVHKNTIGLTGYEKFLHKMKVLLPMVLILLSDEVVEVEDCRLYPLLSDDCDKEQPIRKLYESEVKNLRRHIRDYKHDINAWPPKDLRQSRSQDSAVRTLITLNARVNELTEGKLFRHNKERILIPFFLLALPNEELMGFDDALYPKYPRNGGGHPIRIISDAERPYALALLKEYWEDTKQVYVTEVNKFRNVVPSLEEAMIELIIKEALAEDEGPPCKKITQFRLLRRFYVRMRAWMSVLVPMALILLDTEIELVCPKSERTSLLPIGFDGRPIRKLSRAEVRVSNECIREFRKCVLRDEGHSGFWPLVEHFAVNPQNRGVLCTLLFLNDRLNQLISLPAVTDRTRKKQAILLPFFLLAAPANEEVAGFPDDLYPRNLATRTPIRKLSVDTRHNALQNFRTYWEGERNFYMELAVKEITTEHISRFGRL